MQARCPIREYSTFQSIPRDTLKNCVLYFFSTQRQKHGFSFAHKINHLRG